MCRPCGAYVGTHDGTKKALGRVATAELRKLKTKAHAAFDPFWKSKKVTRRQAYKWLAIQLGITFRECHIGMFDEEQCRQTIKACQTGSPVQEELFHGIDIQSDIITS